MMSLVDDLREHYKQQELLSLFDLARSSYGYWSQRNNRVDSERGAT